MPESPRGADETPLTEDDESSQRRTAPLRRDNSRIADTANGSVNAGAGGSDVADTSTAWDSDAGTGGGDGDVATVDAAGSEPPAAEPAVPGAGVTGAGVTGAGEAPIQDSATRVHEPVAGGQPAGTSADGPVEAGGTGPAVPAVADAGNAAADFATGQRAAATDFPPGTLLSGSAAADMGPGTGAPTHAGPHPVNSDPRTDEFPVVAPQQSPTAVAPQPPPHSHTGPPAPVPTRVGQLPAPPHQSPAQVPRGDATVASGSYGQPSQPPPQAGPGYGAHGQPQAGPGYGVYGQPQAGPNSGAAGGPATAQQPAISGARQRWLAGPWGWATRGVVLCLVALLSGVAWWVFGPGGSDAGDGKAPPQAGPRYQFNLLQKEGWLPGCARVATDKIENFFQNQECVHRTRALYTTTLDNGDRVVTTVTTVLMPDEGKAGELDRLLTQDATGNINDLVDQSMATEEDLPELNDKAYGSERQGELVVIGDSAYLGRDTPENDPRLLDVTSQALQLGWPQDRQQ